MSNQGHLIAGVDSITKTLKYYDGVTNGVSYDAENRVVARCIGDGTSTTFTIGNMPANVIVREVNIYVENTSGTAATTVAIGKSGTTGAYAAASSYTSSMNAVGAKTVTTVKAKETTAQTVIATFSAAWDAAARVVISVDYIRIPA